MHGCSLFYFYMNFFELLPSSILPLWLVAYIDTATLPLQRRSHSLLILCLNPRMAWQAVHRSICHLVRSNLDLVPWRACERVQLVRARRRLVPDMSGAWMDASKRRVALDVKRRVTG